MRLFISAGEPSGDLHAANLVHSIKKLRPDATFVGFGGEHSEKAGVTLVYPLVDLAVMWILRVLWNLPTFFRLADEAERIFRDDKPDAVILIDYPGFHWALAKRAKRHGVPVIYYVPPQIWAWAGWRIKKVQKWVNLVLCSLPFEPEWYHARGYESATYIGHPYFDELAERFLDAPFLADQQAKPGPVVAILPGSRTQEVLRNVPTMLDAARTLSQTFPDVRYVVACLRPRHAEMVQEMLDKSGAIDNLEIFIAKTPELIRRADAAWAVSGSVGLELLAENLPTVVLYRINKVDLWIAKKFIKSKYISLVNLLADREVFPEYLAPGDVSKELAGWAATWLGDPVAKAHKVAELNALRTKVAVPGASDRAAARILEFLGQGSIPSHHLGQIHTPQQA